MSVHFAEGFIIATLLVQLGGQFPGSGLTLGMIRDWLFPCPAH